MNMTPEQHWNSIGHKAQAFVLGCTENSSPRGRQHQRTIAFLLERRLYRYSRLTPLGREVAAHGRAQPGE